jgi:integrase
MGRARTGVRAASASTIEIAFTYRGVRFRPRIRLKPTAANLKRARRHLAAIQDAIERGTFDPLATFPDYSKSQLFAERRGEIVTVERYLEEWIDRRRTELASSTWYNYAKIVRSVLVAEFGAMNLAELRKRHVRDWANRQGVSLKRLRNVVSVLRAALQDAADDELIETNPLYGWTPRRREGGRQRADEIDPFDATEREAILEALGEPARNAIEFAVWTGVRPSELIALQWDDVDWRRGKVYVRRGLTEPASSPEEPKTRAAARSVDLLEPAQQALKRQRAWSQMHPSGHVFLHPRSQQPYTGDQQLRKGVFRPACLRAKVRYRYPYQLRHTFASMMLSAGEPIPWVAAQLGHTDPTVTMRRYYRFLPEAAPNAGAKALEQFQGSGER